MEKSGLLLYNENIIQATGGRIGGKYHNINA